jgi:hypothetical protein
MEAVGQACTQCHTLRPVTFQRRTRERWLETIYDMIGRGAQVRPDEVEPIASYLAANFGPQVPLQARGGAGGPSAASAAGTAGLPDGQGRTVLTERCVRCHAADVVTRDTASRTQADWAATVRRMRALGAIIPAEEEEILTAYLAEHFGARAR